MSVGTINSTRSHILGDGVTCLRTDAGLSFLEAPQPSDREPPDEQVSQLQFSACHGKITEDVEMSLYDLPTFDGTSNQPSCLSYPNRCE